MKKVVLKLALFVILFSSYQLSYGQMKTEEFTFDYNGNKYSGLLDFPVEQAPSAIVVMVHGHGETDVVEKNWYKTRRSKFVSAGIAVCIWDKAGCGKSEGEYKHDQTVQSSAKEALAAIKKLRELDIVDNNKIGLWGISRAGWICPLIVEEDQSIAFWISVSGTDHLESYRYLLESNLRIEGRSESRLDTLMKEWDFANKYQRGGKTFEEFMKGTNNLFQDPYCIKLGMGLDNEDDYQGFLDYYKKKNFVFDKKTGLQIYVQDFDKTLRKVNCPVLSISGEKDSQVDQQKTIRLYKKTIGRNKYADLTIKILPDCNHNMQHCVTGALYEDLSEFNWRACDGYYETMITWVKEKGFGD